MAITIIDTPNVKKIGNILRDLRNGKNVEQKTVFKKIRRGQSHISRIENGKKTPTLPVIVEYLDAVDYELIIRPKRTTKK